MKALSQPAIPRLSITFTVVMLVCLADALLPPPAMPAATMINDPKGFRGIAWGSALANVPDLKLVSPGEHITEYELKQGAPSLGDVKVDAMHFLAYDGEFARVTIRYRGKKTHEQVLAYLQAQFGPIDRSPGSMMRGLNQQFDWRGTDTENTEITLTYEARGERGFVSIDSMLLAPKFNELLPITDRDRPTPPLPFLAVLNRSS
jgi:hypothetical protein